MAGTHDTLPATKKPRCRTHFLCTLPIIISFCLADRGLTEGRVRDHTSILQRFPAGEQLAIASHGCTVQFVSGLHKALASSGAAESQQRQLLRLEQLPLRCVEHLSETTLVGAGFDGEVCPEESPQNPSHAVPPPSEHPLWTQSLRSQVLRWHVMQGHCMQNPGMSSASSPPHPRASRRAC